MESKDYNDIKKVYVYNRLNHEITECNVDSVSECGFAKFSYYLMGSVNHKWHYDLRNGVVRMLESDKIYSSPINFVLVSSDKKSLDWIKESDLAMNSRLKDRILESIKEIV